MKHDVFQIAVPFLAGAIVVSLLGFGAGIITPTSSARSAVAMARVDERAEICREAAIASLNEQGQTDIKSANLNARKELASQFMIETGDATRDRLVQEECSKKLST